MISLLRVWRPAKVAFLLVLLQGPTSLAEPTRLVLLPVGEGPALLPTVAVARALARELQRPGERQARLFYPALDPPEPADRKAQEKQANKLLKRAFAAYDLMEYEKVNTHAGEALKIFKAMLKQMPTAPAEGYLTCLHLLAASALLQGDNKAAFQSMNDAVVFDPQPPSKRLFNPSVQELYEQVRAEPPTPGTITLQSTPPAIAWLNGELYLGSGPVKVRSGLYLIRFYAPGYSATQRWVRVQAGLERPLKVTLTPDGQPEADAVGRLREEARAPEPGPVLSAAALDLSADEIVVISGAAKTCSAARCALRLDWLKDGRWIMRRTADHRGQPEAAAAQLSGIKIALPTAVSQPALGADGTRACTLDDQCEMDERCRNGRCTKPTSITRTWWFWTLVGAAAAGVAVSIAVPLTRPQGPVIEVR